MKYTLIVAISFLLISCGARVKSTFTEQFNPLLSEDKVALLDIRHQVPENSQKLGTARYGDTGFSNDCSFETNLKSARKLARANGANIVKVVKKTTPDLWSTCYRINVEFYYYSGDVTALEQM